MADDGSHQPQKFCIACRYLSVGPILRYCVHPANIETDLVTGRTARAARTPHRLREDPKRCGPLGRWWERKS